MTIHQNILAILREFLNPPLPPKKNYKKPYTNQSSTAATTEFLSKIPNRKKLSNEYFKLCEAEVSLDISKNL